MFVFGGYQKKNNMIKLSELLSEKIKGIDGKACWKGYRYAGTENGKDKCVSINEMGSEDIHYKTIIKHYKNSDDEIKNKIAAAVKKISGNKHKETNIDTIEADLLELGKDDIEAIENILGIDPFNEPIDEAFFIGEDDEYDVENEQDLKEFIQFIKEYTQTLAEAQCDCVYEAEYHGRKVQLGKPMQGDIKKFKVYVKNPKGKVVKVNFGAHGMNIKKNNPIRRKAYRARHHCDNPGPRTKANYWSCRKW